MKKMSDNGEFKGSTKARLDNIDHRLDYMHSDLRELKKQVINLNRKVSYIYGFAGGLGIISGTVAAWLFQNLTS